MYSVFYCIVIYLILGAAGMSLGNKKVENDIRKKRWLKYFTYILITGVVIAAIFLHFFFLVALLIITAGAIELILVGIKNKTRIGVAAFCIYGVVATVFLLFALNFSTPAILFIYFQVLIFDAFGQITGQLFGKNLLVPKISPTKTIEGLIGGCMFCIISAVLGMQWMNISIGLALLFGMITVFTSFCGDVLASWYKRRLRIKDYSNWLPGQGGFLDRFDSFIFTGASYYFIDLIFKTPLN